MQNQISDLNAQLNFIKTLLLNSHKDDLNSLFNTIYQTNYWGCGSGPGSNVELTKDYVKFLQEFFKAKSIKSVVDVGCGDWQFSRTIDFSGISYIGFDVASYVIEQNKKLYEKENVKFVLYDGDFAKICGADLLICKDVLQHLPNDKILNFLKILPKFKYALISNDIGQRVNENILASSYRALDLTKAPFNLNAKKVFSIDRMPKAPDICVMLWENPNN